MKARTVCIALASALAFSVVGVVAAPPAQAGTVQSAFRPALLTPAMRTQPAHTSVLYEFSGPDGEYPSSGLIGDASGNLYGETEYGGSAGYGTVFKLTPPAPGQTAWTESILFNFSEARGNFPVPNGGLAMDAAGALYGATLGGPADCNACGTIFKLSPPSAGKTAWTLSVLHAFTAKHGDGDWPMGGVTLDATGAVYGTTEYGGLYGSKCPAGGCGIVFKLSPPAAGKTVWGETILHSFTGVHGDGLNPTAGVVLDGTGSVYGTTSYGGARQGGTVFKIAPPALGETAWTESVLHSFAFPADPDGSVPYAGVSFGPGGVLYGTASGGGKTHCQFGCGTVFQLTPPAPGQTVWTVSVLYAFTGYTGAEPLIGLTVDPRGPLFGFTDNTAFELTPPASGSGPWTQTVLHAFDKPGIGGKQPAGPMLEDLAGNLYGTASRGGIESGICHGGRTPGCGTVFELTK